MGAKSLRAGDFEEDQIAGAQQYRADFTVLARTLWGAVGYKIGIIPLPVFPLPFVAIATFIPSCLAFHHLMPEFVLQSVKDITQDSNFLDLFISGIIVGSIPGMGRAC